MSDRRKYLQANPRMMAAVIRQREREEAVRLEQERERAEVREGLKETIRIARERGEQVEMVDRGPVRIASRDGLLWLVSKGRLTHAQRTAAETYRADFSVIEGSRYRCGLELTLGGGRSGVGDAEIAESARRRLEDARRKALGGDSALIWVSDEIAGKGTTARELGGNRCDGALAIETEFKVACRLLAKHYGLAA